MTKTKVVPFYLGHGVIIMPTAQRGFAASPSRSVRLVQFSDGFPIELTITRVVMCRCRFENPFHDRAATHRWRRVRPVERGHESGRRAADGYSRRLP